MSVAKPVLSSYEAKLLFALLDAAHDDRLLPAGPLQQRWLEIKEAGESLPKINRAALYRLTEEVDATGALKNTWMHERWLVVKNRVQDDPVDFPASQAPFPPR